MEIIRYVSKAMIVGLSKYRMKLEDFIELADDEPNRLDMVDLYLKRDIPITITIPEE